MTDVAQVFRPAVLYKPQIAYRLRRNANTDTPLPPEFPAGRNPPDGAIIDYYLAADAARPVMLDILTPAGTLVRRYSSNDTPEMVDEQEVNVPAYWVRPPSTLPASRGMHRVVWNLRYPSPGAVTRDYPISAIYRDTPREPLGVLAVPGAYTVKLSVAGATYTQPLRLKMDPRATITPLGLARQFSLATRIVDMMNRSFAEIATLQPPPASPPPSAPSLQPQAPARRSQLASLNDDLATAYDVVEGADRAPTTQAVKAVAALRRRLVMLIGQP